MAEKILAAHCNREFVEAGEYITVKVDFIVGNGGPTALAIKEFMRLGCDRLFDRDRILIVGDHTAPNNTIGSAEVNKLCRDFSRKYGITHFYDVGRLGIAHNIMPEKGLVGAGDLVFGADSHTCTYGALGAFATGSGSSDMLYAMLFGEMWMRVPETIKIVFTGKLPPRIGGKDLILNLIGKIGIDGANYKAIEFTGTALEGLSLDSRFTMANMTIETGAKTGLFEPNGEAISYMNNRCVRPYTLYHSDADAIFDKIITIDVTDMEHQVAVPDLPSNVKPISEIEKEKVRLDQVFIGSCTNSRLEDIRIAAEILKGRKVHKDMRMVVIPGSQEVYREALRLGYTETLVNADVAFCTPTCGPCVGLHMGVLASGEVCASTSNRNFTGRMGHKDSQVYLVGPAVAAASAVTGYITSPESL
jgi:3-isopropylmalate/(R)-2-methylmalate dehydratase large subunit